MRVPRIPRRLKRFARDEDGTTIVEFAVSFVVFLLLFFAVVDFGRMAFSYVVTEKAVQIAARVAAVRPPACTGVPDLNARHPSPTTPLPNYGTACNAGGNICAAPTVSCTGTLANATVNEIWQIIDGRMPGTTSAANLRFSYTSDVNMGFLGGPYTPVVTVELVNAQFNFTTPLAGLVMLLGQTPGAELGTGSPRGVTFPTMSVSLPGEDLSNGMSG